MGIHEHRTCAWQSVVMPLALSGMDRVVKRRLNQSRTQIQQRKREEREWERDRSTNTYPPPQKKKSCLFSSKWKRNALVWYFYLQVGSDGCPNTLRECVPFYESQDFCLNFLSAPLIRAVSPFSIWEYLCCLLLTCNKWPSMHHLCLEIDTRWVLWHHLARFKTQDTQTWRKRGKLYNFMAWSLINGIWDFVSYLGNRAKCSQLMSAELMANI